ncbi:putative calcium-translocating P-type ATPase, PMCA-type [Fusobacterium gonidiaformans 3-1-5R]|uniref:Putative calcium-translocating P-type ATPase, PMCA-type n=2 Tax=Fusobacterium TaxID=848 RepID=E5BDW3_9FUSO|nr:putative calcium-translocating P-type ATPase, PMCA-type [Fusobacterium gonidiaformans 3-1-5R]
MEEDMASVKGLTTEQVKKLQEQYGKNALIEEEKESIFLVFLKQFKDALVMILIAASIVSAVSGNIESTFVIILVLIVNAVIGTVQHVKAQKSMDSLRKLSAPKSKVMRDGNKVEIDAFDLVPGDLVFVEAGDIIPADAKIIESYSLLVNENSLTGESNSVEKSPSAEDMSDLPLGDRTNVVYSGSLVNYGRAVIQITKIGMETEIGNIAKLLGETKEKMTPLQKALDSFGKNLTIVILVLCALIFGIYVYHGNSIMESLLFAIALAVAAIPEGLNPIITIVLSLETQKLAKQNAIVKELKSVESLGSISIICSDKTGTLTQNKMTVKKLYLDAKVLQETALQAENTTHKMMLEECIFCSDATETVGDPTETALVVLAANYGHDVQALKEEHPRLSEIPFDSDRKLMSAVYAKEDKYIMYTKGALDSLLPRLVKIDIDGEVRDITEADIERIKLVNEKFAEDGMRVLSFGYRYMKSKDITLFDEEKYVFLGLVGMIDPPREESIQAVAECRRAGIKPIMITGDHKITARTIARQIGIFEEGDLVLEGVDVEKLSQEELIEMVPKVSVYARVSPEHKIRIVSAWQSLWKICAMTGDGVNDAPALKRADIGIAMGITGTEVSKNAASLILADDNFSTIVKAITIGRNIYRNIKNSIGFLLSGNMAAILAVVYASFANLPVIFSAVQLLFINLLTDSLPAIAVGVEPGNEDVLDEKPRDPKEGILTRDFLQRISLEGILIMIFIVIAFHIGLAGGNALKGSTMAFSVLCLARLFHGFNYRGKRNIFAIGFLKNKMAIAAFFIGFVLLNGVLFTPALYKTFGIAALNLEQYLMIYVLAFFPTVILQIVKWIKYR